MKLTDEYWCDCTPDELIDEMKRIEFKFLKRINDRAIEEPPKQVSLQEIQDWCRVAGVPGPRSWEEAESEAFKDIVHDASLL